MRRALLPVFAAGVALTLAACTSAEMPVPSSGESGSASASAKPRNKPKMVVDGTPKENLPYFLSVMNTAYESSTDKK